ncbi:hypothetical protein CC77DRAFT_411834 [Alternaria alternata]|uniref:Secreted protein n=1 Tax=Alternaria alternata TaxID=5599 RepID=A0A177D8H8_ALTAL|nr:hypothetical protein CC77DRAFT_411834 [Alternaria alternata]KAH6848887.1 hypothetical protein B0T12DRAFT_198574 [Alternaria alternata]OAG16034.1 hypothetical protein CC77DRAFT_411834 [Alternaria alternata]
MNVTPYLRLILISIPRLSCLSFQGAHTSPPKSCKYGTHAHRLDSIGAYSNGHSSPEQRLRCLNLTSPHSSICRPQVPQSLTNRTHATISRTLTHKSRNKPYRWLTGMHQRTLP